ncbi:MAG: NAD-dependent epimerase/dehydratase family protein [Proteobacteria bacterium]|nr:NAD-dependent epimerase/dehydratase family protein [Pseudomonadota bacterium]
MSASEPGRIALTGLGTSLGRRLAESLYQRNPGRFLLGLDLHRPTRLEERVRFSRLDLTEPTADAMLAETLARESIETVVHLGFRQFPTADHELDHELETIGSLHVMNACAAASVRRLVIGSSTMVYGPRADNPNFLTESHPLRGHPDAHSVENRVEVEHLAERWRREHPETEVSVLRPCWIAGPTHVDHVVRFFDRALVPTVMGHDPLLQFVHEDDCLHAFLQATLESHPGVYNVVGAGPLPLSVLLALAGKRSVPVPAPVLYRLGPGDNGDAPAGFFDYLRYLWVADGAKGWDQFGEPAYSTKEAWIAWSSALRMRRYR